MVMRPLNVKKKENAAGLALPTIHAWVGANVEECNRRNLFCFQKDVNIFEND